MLLLGLLEMPMWLILLIVLVVLFYLYTSKKHRVFDRSGIPAIKPAAFIGGFKYMTKNGVMQSEYDVTLQYGKVVGFFLGNLPTVFLTDPDLIREIFVKRYPEFPSRSQGAGISKFWERTILLSTNLEYWKFLRTTMSPSFTSGKLRKMEDIITGAVDRAIEQISGQVNDQDDCVLDMVPVFRNLTLEVICQTALGVEIDSADAATMELKTQVSKLLNFSLEKNPMLILVFLIPDLKKVYNFFDFDYNDTNAISYIDKCLRKVIQERKEDIGSTKQDLLQLMINTTKEGLEVTHHEDGNQELKPSRGMTDEEIIANAMMFLFAGNDTTSTALIFTSYFLATNQNHQEKIRKEIKDKIGAANPTYDNIQLLTSLDMFVSESIRLYPPVTRINRQNTKTTTIGKYTFPANISINVPIFTLHRLPEFWPDPEKFDPERFSAQRKADIQPNTYLPFGVGPKTCLGMRFAQMELKMTLVKILQRFTIGPSPGLQIPPKLEKHVFCRPVGGMKLALRKCS
ncbi:hypothetical protein DPMN_082216 [Dreissena polymorpha]|uniref:Cytochrome P450 n=1 Tax=Dreissena polymorpha TaxID=45954 RepID=A0A9D3Y780_DREPO|nr:hypothetical protein DPMN_082216 [Dreissena polymorpha]